MASTSPGIGSGLPYQGDSSGLYLTTDGTTASWASVAGTGGFNTLGTFDTTPNAKGLSASGTTLKLAAADGTNPGAVTAAAQTLGGAKTFSTSVISPLLSVDAGAGSLVKVTSEGALYGLWLYPGSTTPGNTNYAMAAANDNNLYLNAASGGAVNLGVNGTVVGSASATSLDLTGMGVGGSIKLKSPDGTTYTVHIANGGTWSIA